MSAHSREKKVLVILGISITLGTIILNALGHNPPSAGAFCLSRYYRLGSVKKAILSYDNQSQKQWSQIEIDYSRTESDNIEQLALLSKADSPEQINPNREKNEEVFNGVNYHFIICNGKVGQDGLIQPTEKWQRQSPITAGQNMNDGQVFSEILTDQTIYICVIADNESTLATDCQIKRTEELVEELCRQFNIQPESISYPDSWQ